MALSYRWICLWLVSLFALGNVARSEVLTATCDNASLTINTVTLEYSWSISSTGTSSYGVVTIQRGYQIDQSDFSTVVQKNRGIGDPTSGSGVVSESVSRHYLILVRNVRYGDNVTLASDSRTFSFSVPQTVTIDPPSASALINDPIAFSADGGHGAYVWSCVPSTGVTILPDGDTASFNFAEAGAYSVKVYSEAGGGYGQSATVSATVTVSVTGVTIKAVNRATASGVYSGVVRVTAAKSGQTLNTLFTVSPGDTNDQKIYKTNVFGGFNAVYLDNGPVYIRITRLRVTGPEQAGDSDIIGVVKASDATADFKIFSFLIGTAGPVTPDPTPNTNPLPSPSVTSPTPAPTTMPSVTPSIPTPATPAAPAAPAKPTPSVPIWPPVTVGGSTTNTTSNEVVAGGNSVKTTTTTATDANGAVSTKTEVSTSNTDGTAGQQPAQDLSNALPSVGHVGHYTIAKTQPNFTISMPAQFGGKQFDLDPFRSDRLGGIIDWFRDAVSWLSIVLFGVWASKELAEWVKATSTIRQAQGNAVVGGTGAQATALVAAAAITVAISVFVVAIIGWLGSDVISLGTMLSTVGVNPTSGMLGGAAWMLDRVFPISTLLLCVAGRMTFNLFAAKVFAVAMTVIRWIVP